MKKRIPLHQLKPGMYLVGIDQSWWKTPFLRHHRIIKSQQDIALLKESGVCEVTIDLSRGSAMDDPPPNPADYGVSTIPILPPKTEETPPHHPPPSDSHIKRKDPVAQSHDPFDHSHTIEENPSESSGVRSSRMEAAQEIYQAAMVAVEQIFEGVETGAPIDNPRLRQTVESILDHVRMDPQSLAQLVLVRNLQGHDQTLCAHVLDVCVMACMVGVELSLAQAQLECLASGALLHDVGYVRLPRNLVRKREGYEGYDARELNLLYQHPELGVGVIESCTGISDDIRRIILEHHEREDGSGRPKGLCHPAISLLSGIVAVADRFDCFVSSWGTWPPLPSSLALREMYGQAKAGRFLLQAVEQLIRCLGVYPVGSLVELSTGERGVIVATHPDEGLRPSVKVILDAEGKPLPVPFVLDLASPTAGDPDRHIRILLDPAQEGIETGRYLHNLCW